MATCVVVLAAVILAYLLDPCISVLLLQLR